MDKPAKDEGRSAAGEPWDADLYDSRHSFVWEFAIDLVKLLDPKPGERVLDVGCGTGHLTAQIAKVGAETLGIDNAPAMIEQAQKNYPRLRFELGDARDFHFPRPFDAVFSNAAIHWAAEPARVAACIWRALKPGGRFVAEFGGRGNIDSIVAAIQQALESVGVPTGQRQHPWYFPSIAQYTTLLERQGFDVTYASLYPRPTPLEEGEHGLGHWMNMFGGTFLAGLSEEQRREVIERVAEQLRPRLFRNGTWVADYVRIRVVAWREAGDEAKSRA